MPSEETKNRFTQGYAQLVADLCCTIRRDIWWAMWLAWRIIAVGFISQTKTQRTLNFLRGEHPYVIKSFAKQGSWDPTQACKAL